MSVGKMPYGIVFPERILSADGDVKNVETLLERKPLQVGLSEKDTAAINGCAYLILDFGKEIAGRIRILTYAAGGNAKVRLRFGESVSECTADIGEDGATNDHSVRDFCAELTSWSDMTYGNTGFRFVRLDTESGAELQIKSIVAVTEIDEREQLGSFVCDDPLLNEIWETAAYTLRLCIQNGYLWDGIKRDRLVWIGDLFAEMKAAYCVYGDLPEIRNSLEFVKREGVPPEWINGIPMNSLWWLVELYLDYVHTGDLEFARKNAPFIRAVLDEVDRCVTEAGDTAYGYNFIDWAMHYAEGDSQEKRADELTGVNYLTRIAMEKTAVLLRATGQSDGLCQKILSRLQKKTLSPNSFKQAAALAVLSGVKTERELQVLKEGGVKGLSVFTSCLVFEALKRYGEYDFNLRLIREYFGGMLSLGATTFWEDFDAEAAKNASRIDELPQSGKIDFHRSFGIFCYKGLRHSLCHGWSSGVIPYLAETVLGIRETGIGGRTFAIDAHLSGLKRVRGAYPTKFGSIAVEYTVLPDGRIDVKVNAPKGITIEGVSVKE